MSTTHVALDLAPTLHAVDRYDLDAIETSLHRFAATVTPDVLVLAVLLPLLRHVGDRWQAGMLAPWQEHVVSSLVRTTMGGLVRTLARRDATPRLVMATPSGERHELGLLAATVLASASGAGVTYLGPDLPSSQIVEAAFTTRVDIVVLSATVEHDVRVGPMRVLTTLPAEIELWVGGMAAAKVCRVVGQRARHVTDLETFKTLIDARASP